jgi:hypothetical protein
MALISKHCYGLSTPDIRVSFRKPKFREALRKAGAQPLVDWIETPENARTFSVLHDLRNRIHGAGLQAVTSAEGVFFQVPPELAALPPLIRELCPHTAAISKDGRYLSYYPLSVSLVRKTLAIMNGIAERTDVDRFLPSGHTLPENCMTVPSDGLFSGHEAEAIALLG